MKFIRLPILVLAIAGACLLAAVARADDKAIAIKAGDNMKFDVTEIDAAVGDALNITLSNIGKLPKVAMAHNLVILKPGTDVTAFVTAAAKSLANEYIPVAEADEILASTKLLGPGESDSLRFVPKEAGSYNFVCTFPAHAMLGMRGTITVK